MSFNQRAKSILNRVWPPELVDQVVAETRIAMRHARSRRRTGDTFRGRRDLLVNIGCGSNVVDGWVNIDLLGAPNVLYWDCRQPLPFDDRSVQLIFAEHVFEHLRPREGAAFLAECRRCLQPGGVLRLVVPDAGMYVSHYGGGWAEVVAARPLVESGDGFRDPWLDDHYRTKMELVNAVFRQGEQHKYAYDAETLIDRLRASGFAEVVRQTFGVSRSAHAALDTKERKGESLYVEGVN